MKCSTTGCKNNADKHRKSCHKCRQAEYVKKYPIHAAYYNLKRSAKKRNKDFDITRDEFVEFCKKTNYIENKGVSGNSYQIDRIDPEKGYTILNIRVLTAYLNNKRERVDLGGLELDPNKAPF